MQQQFQFGELAMQGPAPRGLLRGLGIPSSTSSKQQRVAKQMWLTTLERTVPSEAHDHDIAVKHGQAVRVTTGCMEIEYS